MGGADYILKPFDAVELQARVRVALRTKGMFDLLKEQARIDALTGLKNRAAGRLLGRIKEVVVRSGSDSVGGVASAGLVEADDLPSGFQAADILQAADAALYRAKREGRDRLELGVAAAPRSAGD